MTEKLPQNRDSGDVYAFGLVNLGIWGLKMSFFWPF